ncbi:MAG: phosphatase PAP2 family protein, partial [Hyphomicrobiales bacterium]
MTIEARLKIAVIVAIAAIDAVWASVAGIRFDWPGALQLLVACPVLALVWAYYALKRGEAGLATMARETLFLLSFSGATALLSYLVTTLNRPLIDETLVAVDAAIGFDWMAYIAFINAHPLLGDLSTGFYLSSLPLIALAIAVLPLIGKADRAAELLTTVMVGALIAIAISGILPASGALAYYQPSPDFYLQNGPLVDLDYKQTFFDLRSGAPVLFSLAEPKGLIAFPSYHVALGAILMLTLRDMPRFLVPVMLINGTMILTTPIDGGHHMVDGIAGFALGLVAFRLSLALRAVFARRDGEAAMSGAGAAP